MSSFAFVAIGPDRPEGASVIVYADWLKDFERRLALHDEGVAALARDLALRTGWTVRAEAPGFAPPEPCEGRPPDVMCDRGAQRPPVVFEVELPETLVRRETVRRLGRLVDGALETRIVVIADDATTRRSARRAGCCDAPASTSPSRRSRHGPRRSPEPTGREPSPPGTRGQL